jgi:hypothetical protein
MKRMTLGLLLLAGGAVAEDKKPPLPPQLEQLKFWNGTWTCEGKVHATAIGSKEKTITSKVTQAPALQDRWFTVNIEEKSAQEPGTLQVMVLVGWDVAQKHFVSMNATSSGSSGITTSDGWQGDKWTWSGEGSAFSGKTYKSRSVTTKKGTAELDIVSEVNGGDGKWVPFRETHCKKEK